jgi:D-threo-aldose 1-dehydrogenase
MHTKTTDIDIAGGRPWLRPLGATGLTVSAVCVGAAPLGSMPQNFGYEVAEEDGVALVTEILRSPLRFLDTSNGYSGGESERRVGLGIARAGGLPDDFVIATKVDAKEGDYSGARVRASVDESRARLGLDVLPMVYLHDPEFFEFEEIAESGGAVDTLVRLRDDGVIGHLGLAGGDVHEMARYLDLGVFEVVLVHNRWTLVDRSAGDLLDQAAGLGVAVVNAAIYGGGLLAKPGSGSRSYGYRPAAEATLDAVRDLAALCDGFGTDLPSAALAASLRDDRITSTVVGFSRPERIPALLEAARLRLPDEFWSEAEGLLPSRDNWLDFRR